jgi:multimeric flavodoxin WrbA
MAEMIKFYFEDQFAGAKATAMVTTGGEDLGTVVSAFKTFLGLVGYHQDNIAGIKYDNNAQGFRRGDGNPGQGDFFDDKEDSGNDDGSESGV